MRNRSFFVCGKVLKVGLWACVLACGQFVQGSLTGYLKIPDIEGESAVADHEGEIDVYGISWDIEVDLEADSGRTRAVPEFSSIEFSKRVDKATPLLMLGIASGKVYSKAELFVDQPGTERSVRRMHMVLENVRIDRHGVSGQFEDGELGEDFSLNYETISFEYISLKEDGSPGESTEFSWDVEQGTNL